MIPDIYPNSTGTYGDILKGRSQLGFSSKTYFSNLNNVDISNSFIRHDICILVPKAGDEPVFFNLLRAFSKLSWAILVLSLVFICAIFRTIQEIQSRNINSKFAEYDYTICEVFTMHYQATFGDTVMKLPLRVPLQSVLISWCLFTFLIASGFTAKLISSLVINRPMPDINNFRELIDSNLKVISTTAIHDGLKNIYPTHTLIDKIINNVIPIQTDAEFERLIETNKSGNAYIMLQYLASHMINKHYNKFTDKSHYHLMKNCLLSLPEVYLASAGSPYIDYINELLGLFHAHGFFNYWWHQVKTIYRGQKEDIQRKVNESEIKVVITLDHMKAAFCLWGIGILMACTILFGEFIQYKIKQFKNRNVVIILNKLAAKENGCFYD